MTLEEVTKLYRETEQEYDRYNGELIDSGEWYNLAFKQNKLIADQAKALTKDYARVEKLLETLKFVENHIHPDTPKSHIKTYKEAAYKVAKHASQDNQE